VERSGTPGEGQDNDQPAKAGDRAMIFVGWSMKRIIRRLVFHRIADPKGNFCRPPSRANDLLLISTWGSAALHPRLYAIAGFAG